MHRSGLAIAIAKFGRLCVIFVRLTRPRRSRHVRFARIASEPSHRSDSTPCATTRLMHRSKSGPLSSARGHCRQINPLPTLSGGPLRSDRVRTFAPQRFDAVCHEQTHAVRKIPSFDNIVGAGDKHRRNLSKAERPRQVPQSSGTLLK